MKGILLAGGRGSRLYPLTKCINKHLLPVGNKPMAQWALEKFVEAGITEILIISGKEQCGTIIHQFGDGKELGCDLTYKVQMEAGGIAQALSLAESFVGDDSMCVILGDNIFSMSLRGLNFDSGAMILLKEVKNPNRYGVAEIEQIGDKISVLSIEEKPLVPKTNYAVTGIYFYDKSVFDKIRKIKPSDRNELEITDINNLYIKENKMVAKLMSSFDFWSDAGTFESYSYVNEIINKLKE